MHTECTKGNFEKLAVRTFHQKASAMKEKLILQGKPEKKKEQGKMNLIKQHRNAKMDSVLYT